MTRFDTRVVVRGWIDAATADDAISELARRVRAGIGEEGDGRPDGVAIGAALAGREGTSDVLRINDEMIEALK